MSENPWLPPVVRDDSEPPTPLWRLLFGWIAAVLSGIFAVSSGVFLLRGLYGAIPASILLSVMLWRTGKNLRLNRPVP
ncbi:MAG: hypothetical protein ACKO2L_15150 [Planctomycetaceae bacterium]